MFRKMREVIQERIDNVQRWLLAQQHENGSWNNSAWHTAKIIIALVDTGISSDHPQLEKAYHWLADQKVNEGLDKEKHKLISWENWTWDTALVLRAISRLEISGKTELIEAGLRWMISAEKDTLNAGDIAVSFGRCYTAQTILAILETKNRPRFEKDVNFFIRVIAQ